MYYYKLYGQIIESDVSFRQLVLSDDHNASITIHSGAIPEDIRDKENTCNFGDSYSWLSNRTCYLVIRNGNEIIYELKPGKNHAYMLSFILGYGIAMLHMQRGEISIHCSALSFNDKAILVAGKSGSGKSTVTTALIAKGCKLMADDMAVIQINEASAIAYPAFPYQKLCRDAALANGYDLEQLIYIDEEKDKFLIPFEDDFSTSGKEIAAMFILMGEVNSKEVVTQQIKGIAKIPALADNLFLKALMKDERFKGVCGQSCVKAADKFPIYAIGRPAGVNTVDIVRDFVIDNIN